MSTLHFWVEGALWPVLQSLLSVSPGEVALTVGITVSLDCRPVRSGGVALPAAPRPWTAAQDTGALAAASPLG